MAGSSLIGNLAVLLTMETAAFEKGASHASKTLRKTQREFQQVGDKMLGLGKNMSAFITLPLAGLAAKGIQEARETAAAMGQVNAALASMGPVAGKTASQLSKTADALERSSLYEADQILKDVTATLLTFGNVQGEVFDRAQQATIDLAARFGGDLSGRAIQVGKALQDPIKGITALTRVGVTFTDQQKDQIKAMVEAGNAAGAQALILRTLETQVRGSAQAAQNADPFDKLKDSFNQMAESIGTALLPLIPPLTDAITGVLNAFTSLSPTTQKWVLILGGTAAAMGPVLIGVGSLVTVTGTLLPLILKIGPAFVALKAAIMAVTAASSPLLAALLPFAVPLLAIAAAVGAVYLAYRNWDKIGPIVSRMVGAVTSKLNQLAAPFKWVINQAQQVGNAFFRLYDRVVGHSYIPDMVAGIAAEMAKLDAVMVQPVKKGTAAAAEAFKELQQRVRGLLAELYPTEAQHATFLEDLKALEDYAKKAGWSVEQLNDAVERLKQNRGQIIQLNPSTMEGDPIPDEVERVKTPFDEWAATIPQTAAQITTALQGIAANGFDRIADGIVDAISGAKSLGEAFRDVAQQIIADLIRMSIRMMMFKALSGAFPGMFPPIAGARAAGGPVARNKLYLVGERGPELFAPGVSGNIIPNHQMGGGGSPVHIHMSGPMTDAQARRTGMQAAAGYRHEMNRASNKGI